MEMQGFQFVEVRRAHDNYRIFLKDSTFIGNYTEWEALLVANAIERALASRCSAKGSDLIPFDPASLTCSSPETGRSPA